jgi:hypothetical protein
MNAGYARFVGQLRYDRFANATRRADDNRFELTGYGFQEGHDHHSQPAMVVGRCSWDVVGDGLRRGNGAAAFGKGRTNGFFRLRSGRLAGRLSGRPGAKVQPRGVCRSHDRRLRGLGCELRRPDASKVVAVARCG